MGTMNNPAHTTRSFWPCFNQVVASCTSALEVGCGDGNMLRRLPHCTPRTGIEIFAPYVKLDHPSNAGINFIFGDALDYLPRVQSSSYDLVLLMDIVEHFRKEDGWTVLRHADRIARKLVLLWIPEGLDPQSKEHYCSEQYAYQPYQDHLSQWWREELEAFGFDVAVWPNYHWDRSIGDKENKTIAAMFCLKTPAIAHGAHDDERGAVRGDGATKRAAARRTGGRRRHWVAGPLSPAA
jgi:SAM-dependent methyltransferase